MESIIGKQFPAKVIPLIDNAKQSIDIVVFDWRWYADNPANPVQLFNHAIVRAVRRGVVVRAIANSNDIISVLNSVGVKAKKPATPNLIHSKIIIIDNETMVIGSHNYSQSAFTMNHEASIIIKGAENILNFNNYFSNLYNNYD